ncbi:MAG TPA: sensor histidine kinase [Chloroflexi bacterium]|nr:sensor histidine kinase [Chloroflexota bacterium]
MGEQTVSLKTRFLVVFIAGAVLPLTLIGVVQTISSYTVHRTHVDSVQYEIARNVTNEIDNYLGWIENELSLAAYTWFLPVDQPKKTRYGLLNELLAYNNAFHSLTVIDDKGQEMARASRYTVFDEYDLDMCSDSPEFQVAIGGDRYLSPVSFTPYGEPLVALAVPMWDVYHRVDGVLIAQVNLTYMWDIIARIDVGSGGYTYMVDGQQRLIAHEDSSLVLQQRDLSDIMGVQQAQAGRSLDHSYLGLSGERVIGSYQTLAYADWCVLVEVPMHQALSGVYRTALVNGLAVLATLWMSGWLGWYIVRTVLHPLRQVQDGAAALGQGDLSHRIDIQALDEIGALAQAFNDMASRLQGMIAERAHLQNLLQNITDSMPSALITLNPAGRVLTWNPAAEALAGGRLGQAQERVLWEACPELLRYQVLFEQVLQERRMVHRHREQLLLKNRPVYRDVSVFPLIANGVEGVVLRIDDVTRRVRLEEMMLQSAKMASVGGLAAGVAHEINNPLGAMMQSAQILQVAFDVERPRTRKWLETCDVDPDNLARYLVERGLLDYIVGIRETGARAAKIVSDLLSFSRKTSSDVAIHNLNQLVVRTLDLADTDYDLKKRYDFRNICVMRDLAPDLPALTCDGQQIQQVILNLLRNAAQAMSKMLETTEGYQPLLKIRTEKRGAWVRLVIEDNGPGIPDTLASRLFEPFFTSKEVGEGTGLGLWLCWSIVVERHGGRIWYEPVLSRDGTSNGTRFFVQLPVSWQGKPLGREGGEA